MLNVNFTKLSMMMMMIIQMLQWLLQQIIEKKLQFITVLTAILTHIENSQNDNGYIT